MENQALLRKRLLQIMLAALCGAACCDLLIVADNLTDWMWRHGHLSKGADDFFVGLAWMLALPAAAVTPPGRELANPYLVDGILGALVFGGIAAFWNFAVKGGFTNRQGRNED
jgi:hypothetical protein